jgi:hypothetical protein
MLTIIALIQHTHMIEVHYRGLITVLRSNMWRALCCLHHLLMHAYIQRIVQLAPIKDSELSFTLINASGSTEIAETYTDKAAALAVDALMTPQAVNKNVIVNTANTDSTSTAFTNAKML